MAVQNTQGHWRVARDRSRDSLAEGRPWSRSERPLSMLRNTASLPQLDQSTRERLLCVVETANPQFPDHAPDALIRDHSLLSLSSLQSWLDLFFTHFNTTYPLIHMATFEPESTQPLLLLAVILLGATYSDKAAHQAAVCIHDVIRPSIFAHAGFSPSPELWTLQTLLLVECFGKSRSGQKQHDMSHLFHGLLINLIRRSDCQSIGKTKGPPENHRDAAAVQEAWKVWAESEQKKRLALLCFMWDTQHAVLFCQSLCMSAFELRCELPHAQSVWEAPDPESWAVAWRSLQPPPLFLPMLKAYLAPRPALEVRPATNAFSLVLVLHGIMSIAWDMQRRDQTSLGVHTTVGAPKWRDVLSEAYHRWKIDFGSYCGDAIARGDQDSRNEWQSFSAAYKAVYHAAQSLLYMEFLDIQIYAGARHILGRPVRQHDYIRSSKIVKRWAANSRERAATATWHAANMLADVLMDESVHQGSAEEADATCPATNTNLFHVPWCIYLATLTCWAFHHAKASRGTCEARSRGAIEDDDDLLGEDSDFSDEMVWDSHKEMRDLIRDMVGSGREQNAVRNLLSIQGRKGTNGLAWLVADLLSKVRWGIVHAGVMVLRGLVPMRLINQYETAY
ncbi:fungal-specific transcription factor domain-domain-containing protein, partial [Coniella lustricola]